MAKRPSTVKQWILVTSTDGTRRGDFEVSGGQITVRFGGRRITTRAPSTGVPVSLGEKADEAFARSLLNSEF
jgi:hypothetical protein